MEDVPVPAQHPLTGCFHHVPQCNVLAEPCLPTMLAWKHFHQLSFAVANETEEKSRDSMGR